MRVAVNAEQLLYRSPGGIGRYTAQLLTVLPGLFPDDELVPFVARHRRGEVEEALRRAGVPAAVAARTSVLRWPRPLLYDAWLAAGRPRLPDLGGAELVHAPSVAVPPRDRRPLVVTVHDAAVELFPEAFPRRGRRFHRRGTEAAAARADLVVAVSQAAADELVRLTPLPAERIRVVPQGVDAPEAADERHDAAMLGGRGLLGRSYVLWVGSLEPRKGVDVLVSAMAALKGKRAPAAREVQLVLAGYAGWLGAGQIHQARAVLGDALHELGPVSDQELWALYRGCTVFAFPSRHEGFGLPVLEAMAAGAAVVCSDLPSLREVAGEAARFAAVGDVAALTDALADLLGDDRERRRLGEEGRRRAAIFTVEATMRATRAVYDEALGLAR